MVLILCSSHLIFFCNNDPDDDAIETFSHLYCRHLRKQTRHCKLDRDINKINQLTIITPEIKKQFIESKSIIYFKNKRTIMLINKSILMSFQKVSYQEDQ